MTETPGGFTPEPPTAFQKLEERVLHLELALASQATGHGASHPFFQRVVDKVRHWFNPEPRSSSGAESSI